MNKKTIYIICITVSVLAIVGIIRFSFAYFQVPITGSGTTSGLTSERLVLSFDDSVSSMNKENIFPGDSFTKTISVTNVSNKNSITYDLVWESINNTFLYNEIHIEATCESFTGYGTGNQVSAGACRNILEQPTGNSTSNPVISGIVINKGYTHVYTVTITFIETGESQEYNKGKVFSAVLGVQGKGQIVATSDCTSTDTSLKCTIINDNTALIDSDIDFSQISSDTNGKGLYYTNDLSKNEDNKGIYYYRGAVTNNYMIFAGFCWRIVRTNEDGSIKIRYGGVPTSGVCPQTGTDVNIGSSSYNDKLSDNAYIGFVRGSYSSFTTINQTGTATVTSASDTYTYSPTVSVSNGRYVLGNTKVIAGWNTASTCTSSSCAVMDYYSCLDLTSPNTCDVIYQIKGYVGATKMSVAITSKNSTSYSQAHGSGEDSTIKGILDTWYNTNINSKGSAVTSKIADSAYCNDRSLFTGIGYGLNSTYYYGYHRLANAKSPQYKCNNDNDKFTVSNNTGNTLSTYPVTMLTSDEIAYAGGVYNTNNTSYYLYTGASYWTLTPSDFTSYKAFVINQNENGALNTSNRVTNSLAVVPSISLLPTALVSSGNGEYNSPYIVE